MLVAFVAAHSILAKWLYAHPPPGVEPRDAEVGAQLMYYGGDVVDVTLILLLCLGWYRATRPRETPTSVQAPGFTPGWLSGCAPVGRDCSPSPRRGRRC